LDFAPILFVSAKTEYRVHQIFPLLQEVWAGRQISVDEQSLDVFLKKVTRKHLPSKGIGVRHPKILSLKQINANPPVFELMIKQKTSLSFSYVKFLRNRLREEYGFFATPIIIKLAKFKQ
jgi:GTP-binding protein